MKKTGIYFLMNRKKVVYIGQTIAFPARIKNHKDKEFDRIRFIPCNKSKLTHYERRLIYIFQPKHNVNGKKSATTSTGPSIRISGELYQQIKNLSITQRRQITGQAEYMLKKAIQANLVA